MATSLSEGTATDQYPTVTGLSLAANGSSQASCSKAAPAKQEGSEEEERVEDEKGE